MYQLTCPVFVIVMYWVNQGSADVGLLDYSAQCVTEAGVTHDEADKIQQGNLPSNQQGKCYVACVLKSLGLVDRRGKISAENTNRLIDMYSNEPGDAKDKTKQAVNTCATEANRAWTWSQCEVAYRMMSCILRTRGSLQQTRSITITLPQSITINPPPLSFTLFSVG
uniref:Odorant-binding protein 28 n=1 Tax=Adelphocoris lineolatus TaxID=236346 RepID=A0A346RVH3_ADELI|nr:odorant-binding protein 28 [Adelphocoris lineolatus]